MDQQSTEVPTDIREQARALRNAWRGQARATVDEFDDRPGDEGGWGHQSELGISKADRRPSMK